VHTTLNACCGRKIKPVHDYIIPGWNEFVSEKHKSARDAYGEQLGNCMAALSTG